VANSLRQFLPPDSIEEVDQTLTEATAFGFNLSGFVPEFVTEMPGGAPGTSLFKPKALSGPD